MGKTTMEIFYPEPEVLVRGKYNRDVNIDTVKHVVAVLKKKYGRQLNVIEIMYDKRKDGIKCSYRLWTHDAFCRYEADRRVSNIEVFYACVKKYIKGEGTKVVEPTKTIYIPLNEIEKMMDEETFKLEEVT